MSSSAFVRDEPAEYAATTSMPQDGANAVLGTWKLVSYERHLADGAIEHPFGLAPVGLVIFDAIGNAAVQIMRSEDGIQPSRDPGRAARVAARDYIAYFATCELQPDGKTIALHVKGSVNTNWVGSEQRRHFVRREDELIITTPRETNGTWNVLRWEKL